MSDSAPSLDLINVAQASKEVTANALFDALSPALLYGRRSSTCSGLIWGFYGGRYTGLLIANGSVNLSSSATNYVVALRSTGVVSVASTITNWNDTNNYARLYLITTGASTVSGYEDHRQAIAPPTSVATVNVFTKNQSCAPAALTVGAAIPLDASLSNNFKFTLTLNATLGNPTNSTDGMVLNIRVKQDSTGSKTLSYGSAYKFAGGAAPSLSTAGDSVDLITMYYDSSDAAWACVMSKGFA